MSTRVTRYRRPDLRDPQVRRFVEARRGSRRVGSCNDPPAIPAPPFWSWQSLYRHGSSRHLSPVVWRDQRNPPFPATGGRAIRVSCEPSPLMGQPKGVGSTIAARPDLWWPYCPYGRLSSGVTARRSAVTSSGLRR